MKSISIVIVTWNCKKFIAECLDSLRPLRHNPEIETIIVDNASWDGTPELVRDCYPDVMLIRSQENLGFTKGNNLGIRKTSGKYLCLINPDVRVLDGCIEKMYEYMENNPQVGLLGPRMLNSRGKSDRSYMGAPTLWNLFCRALALDTCFPGSKILGGFLMNYFDRNQIAEVDILNGWFWMARSGALNQVGLLDEELFMYADDLDWSKRFHKAGWKVVYFPAAESIHYGGGTTDRAPIRFTVEMHRANFQYWQKNYGKMSQFIYRLIIGLHHCVRLAGYSLAFLKPGSSRAGIRFKLRRSVVGLQWTIGHTGALATHSPIRPETKPD